MDFDPLCSLNAQVLQSVADLFDSASVLEQGQEGHELSAIHGDPLGVQLERAASIWRLKPTSFW